MTGTSCPGQARRKPAIALDKAEEEYRRVANAAGDLRRERENQRELVSRVASRKDDMAAAQAENQRQDEKIAQCQETLAQSDDDRSRLTPCFERRAKTRAPSPTNWRARPSSTARRINWKAGAGAEKRAALLASEADVLRERIRGLEAQAAAVDAADIDALRGELRDLQGPAKTARRSDQCGPADERAPFRLCARSRNR